MSPRKRRKAAGKTSQPAREQWDIAAAKREFERNKQAVESGRTFRARQGSGWRLGGSPSSAGEIKR